MKTLTHSVLLAALLGMSLPAAAAIQEYTAILNGHNETFGGGIFDKGDLNGYGVATLLIDDVANTISWNIDVGDIALPLTGAHIHQGDASVAGPILINFSSSLTGSGLFDTDLAAVVANPGGFYVNLHTSEFPAGAIRGQIAAVPEPAEAGLMLAGLGLIGWRVSQRKRA
jgi:hypothetical protein